MSKNSEFSKLRIDLDNAITYGTKIEAKRIARKGLKEAKDCRLQGEVEYFLGQIDLLNNKFTSAIEHFDAAIKYNPKDGASYNDRALCMIELGIMDEAIPYFDKGIEVEPDYATIYHNKGWLLNNLGEYTKAIKYFQKALQLEPERAVTYDNLADARYNLNDFSGALEAYRKVLSLLKPGQCRQIKSQIRKKIKELENREAKR
ncbi:MAG: tetratricopeptide repeat protein [Candidatus Omnitrophica bacterium]|nr:tetratricopeptide repeat protein [Candidatus Omnitrophota bacterium]